MNTAHTIENELHTVAQWAARQYDNAVADYLRHDRLAKEYEAAGDTTRAARQRMLAEGDREDIASAWLRLREASANYLNRVAENSSRSH